MASIVTQSSYNVLACPSPYSAARVDFAMPAASSLDDVLIEVVRRTGCQPAQLRHAAIVIGDRVVAQDWWSYTYPKAGATVIVRALPGDDFASLFVTIAGFALAAAIPGSGLVVGLIKAGISVAATLTAHALAPAPRQNLSRGSDGPPDASFSVTGIQNRANPYGIIPEIFGKVVNYHPPLGAAPYTEIRGGENQWIRMLFVVGHGKCEVSNIKIGTTPIERFQDLQYAVRDGSVASSAIGLFPSQVREEALSIELKQTSGYSLRTTPLETDEIALDIAFPNGLIRISDRNVKFPVTVQFQVQYRAVGSGAWLAAPLAASRSIGAHLDGGGLFHITSQKKSAVRRSVGWDVARGQYDVRVRRVTVDDQSDNEGKHQSVTTEASYWIGIRSFQIETPINAENLAIIAVRARATDQINGVIDQLNCTVERHLPVWNGSSWTTQKTRNPAWAFARVLTGPNNARALANNRLDLTVITAWANRCTSAGRTFDGVIDFESTVWQLLQDIAATGRGSPTVIDGLYSVVEDRAQTVYRQRFSPHNTRNIESSKTLTERPHAIKVRFPNEQTQGQVDERIVYDDGYSAANATRFEALDLRYTTDTEQAYKFGRYALAAARLRSEVHQFETDWEHLPISRGDLVPLTWPVLRLGLGSARVKSVTLNGGGDVTAISIDMPQTMESGTTYAVEMRLADNTQVVKTVNTVAGEQSTLTFDSPITVASQKPTAGVMLAFGESGLVSADMIVRSVVPRADRTARITVVDAAPAIHTADTQPIPDPDPRITLPPILNRATPPVPRITSVDSDEDALLVSNNGSFAAQILLGISVRTAEVAVRAVALQARYRLEADLDNWQWLPNMPAETALISVSPVEEGVSYVVQVRTVSEYGLASEWIAITHTVIGQTTPPPGIDRMLREGSNLYWDYEDPPVDFAGFRVKAHYGVNTNWASARQLHAGLLSASRFDISSLDGTQTIMVKAVDRAGNESLEAAIVTINLGDPLTDNLILTQSEAPSFSGEITGGSVVSSELVADIDSDPLFWAEDDTTFWGTDASTVWPTVTYASMSYAGNYEPVSNHVGATIKLALDITGEYQVDYREVLSPTFWGSDGSTFWGSDSSTFWAASEIGDWIPWPGQLGPLNNTTFGYDIRVTLDAGDVQGVITELDILVDVPDIIEYFEDVAIAATGTPRLTLTKTYRAIKVVNVNTQEDGGSAVNARVKDKSPTLGPNIETLDTSGSRTAGTIGAVVIGY